MATALDVIAAHGVAGTTYRRIAKAAGVPLGSMTYYLKGIEQVIEEAFALLVHDVSQRYEAALEAARSIEDAREAIVQLICGSGWQW